MGYSLLLKTRETVFRREHHGTVPLSGSSLISMFMTLHLSGKGRYIEGQKSFLNGKSHKHCRGFHMSLPGDGSFDSPQSRTSKEKKFMVLPRSGFGGLHRKAQGSVLGQRSWHLLAENCSAMCCRMNKMYRLSRQKQLEKPC